jgi:hypothetical protein
MLKHWGGEGAKRKKLHLFFYVSLSRKFNPESTAELWLYEPYERSDIMNIASVSNQRRRYRLRGKDMKSTQ